MTNKKTSKIRHFWLFKVRIQCLKFVAVFADDKFPEESFHRRRLREAARHARTRARCRRHRHEVKKMIVMT